MFYEFKHRHTPCLVDGEKEIVIISRESKGTSLISKEYLYNGLFAPTSLIANGSFVETEDSFLVQTMRLTTDRDRYCSLLKTNVTAQIQRYKQEYDDNGNEIGDPDFVLIQEAKGFAQFVSAKLKLDDPGLLPTTSYILILQTVVDVRRPQDKILSSPDRVLLNGRAYQVDTVDDLKYPNLLHVQLSEDLR